MAPIRKTLPRTPAQNSNYSKYGILLLRSKIGIQKSCSNPIDQTGRKAIIGPVQRSGNKMASSSALKDESGFWQ
ncbi:hypothetical protein HNY73_018996 [Argiope bruennichi]|uniref:Uncharacterized protein n=1 Tax=Argiope bruennichi TaxID=94029 RepID=A0A8T0EG28_ARGBR|nr:hypothetical protein HNY73_018996 [Argiope bruennichi]